MTSESSEDYLPKLPPEGTMTQEKTAEKNEKRKGARGKEREKAIEAPEIEAENAFPQSSESAEGDLRTILKMMANGDGFARNNQPELTVLCRKAIVTLCKRARKKTQDEETRKVQ